MRAAAAALIEARRVELAAYNRVAQADVLHATTAHQDHRVFLERVSFAGDVGHDLHAIGEPDARYFADGGVRLAGGLGRHARADAALERSGVKGGAILERIETAPECDSLGAIGALSAPFAYELVDGCHEKVPF